MLDCTCSNLLAEADAAIAVRDAQLRELKNVTGIFTGPYSHAKSGEHWPDNFVFQYLSFALPKTCSNNPRFKFKSSQSAPKRFIEAIKQHIDTIRQGVMGGMVDPAQAMPILLRLQSALEAMQRPRQISDAMQWGMNQWFNQSTPDEHVLTFVQNCLTMYGVMKTTQVKKGDGRIPKWESISPRRFAFDPLCLMFGGARYSFEQIIRDQNDILKAAESGEEEGWNIKVVKGVAVDTGAEEMRTTESSVATGTPKRGEVAYYEYWVNEDLDSSPGPDEGFHGTIYTASKGCGEFLREPRPYYGPAWGPYCLGGVYPVLDSAFPLSPVMANYAQAKDHNDQVRAAMSGAKTYKRIVFVPAGNPDVAKTLTDSPHDYVIPIKGLKKDEVIPVEIGGLTDQQLKQIQLSSDILRKSSGMTENNIGDTTGDTATESAIVDESSQTRMAFVQQRINHAICQAGRTAAWFIYHDDKTQIRLGEDAGDALEMGMPLFKGGHDASKGDDFDDLGMEIDVMSMPWSGQNQEKQSAVLLLDQVVKIAPLIPTTPQIDWKDVLNRVGDSFNESDFGDVIDDAAMQQQAMMQQQQMQGEAQGQQVDQGMAVQQHQSALATDGAKRMAIQSGARDKSAIAKATVNEKALKGRSYGAKIGAARRKK